MKKNILKFLIGFFLLTCSLNATLQKFSDGESWYSKTRTDGISITRNRVGILTTTPSYTLDVKGTAQAISYLGIFNGTYGTIPPTASYAYFAGGTPSSSYSNLANTANFLASYPDRIVTQNYYFPVTFNENIVGNITTANYANDLYYPALQYVINKYSGVVTTPTYTDNLNGTIYIHPVTINIYTDPFGRTLVKQYRVTGNTFTLSDEMINYVYIDYNSGSPLIINTTTRDDVTNTKLTNKVALFRIYRSGTVLHIIGWDSYGTALAEKLVLKSVDLKTFERVSGLALSETATRIINISAGNVYYGVTMQSLLPVISNVNNVYFCYHSAGNWNISTTINQYNNTQYDNGIDLVTLLANRYAVNWVYRGIEDETHAYVVLGAGDYTLAQAQASQPPAVPALISSHAILVGRIIVQKSATTATQIDSAFSIVFSPSGVQEHNDLSGIQGGISGEYYHLRALNYNGIVTANCSKAITLNNPTNVFYGDGSHLTNVMATSISGNISFNGIVTANNFYFNDSHVPTETIWIDPVYLDSTAAKTPGTGRLAITKQEYIKFSKSTSQSIHIQVEVPEWNSYIVSPSLAIVYTVSANTVATTCAYTLYYKIIGDSEQTTQSMTSKTGYFTPSASAWNKKIQYISIAPAIPGKSIQLIFERGTSDTMLSPLLVLNFGIAYHRRKL